MMERLGAALMLARTLSGVAAPTAQSDVEASSKPSEACGSACVHDSRRVSRMASAVPATPVARWPRSLPLSKPAPPVPLQPKRLAGEFPEFVSFGFVPTCPVVWTAALAMTTSRGAFVDRLRFFDLQPSAGCTLDSQTLRHMFPRYLSWWSRGLLFSANGQTAVYTLPPDTAGGTNMSVLHMSTAPLAGRILSMVPRTHVSEPAQVSGDGLLFCHRSTFGHDIYLRDAMTTPLLRVPDAAGDNEVHLCNERRFYVMHRNRQAHTTSVRYFGMGATEAVCIAGRRFAGDRWRLAAGAEHGCITLLDTEVDRVCQMSLFGEEGEVSCFAAVASDSFAAVCSPDGQYLALVSAADNASMCLQRVDARGHWYEVMRVGDANQTWQSVRFSSDVSSVAFVFYQEPTALDTRRGSGCWVYHLGQPSQPPFTCFYDNTEIRRAELSPDGRYLALLVRQDFSYRREMHAFGVHVWPVRAAA